MHSNIGLRYQRKNWEIYKRRFVTDLQCLVLSLYIIRGRSQKTSAQNRKKLTPLVRNMSALAQPPPLVRADTP